ncbi:WW domain-binding protein 11-like [Sorghum bicolor]|uniref:WW domain-binding protein 11-like n=1 Tax=Sorghum bicolor TaxID=4558 RepID=UPI000B426657|nr:WW domain-binding protein 11-like [Sorghum bicolor]|eukprot:XP_021314583.1 WW domain-binding protein 11-like [Sorghum bicolor]
MDTYRKTHGNVPISEYVGYALANKGRASDPNNVYNPQDGPDAYTNTAAYEKMSAYATAARTRHGDDFDLTTEPLDTDLLMRTGGGKQHGRYMIAHSAINPATVPTLREVRQGSSSTSDVPIRPRQPSSVQQIAAMQSQLEELRTRQDELQEAHRRELAAALAARDEAHRRHMEAQQQHTQRQISDLVGYFQSIQSSTAPPLPASLFAPPPVPPPVPAPAGSPHQSWGSNPTPSPESGWQVTTYGHPSTQHTWPGAHPQHGHPGLSGSPPPRPGYSYPYPSVPGQAMWAPWADLSYLCGFVISVDFDMFHV